MLKLKKLFTFGLLTAAVALFIPSCTEDDPDDPPIEIEPDAYEVRVTIEGGNGAGAAVADEDDTYLTTTYAYAGDIIYLNEGQAASGTDHEFAGWVTVPSNLANSIVETTTPGIWRFNMPAYDVTVRAVWESPDVAPQTYIRFTWEAAEEPYIVAIMASEKDVEDWYNDVFMDPDYNDADATAEPLFTGSPILPDNIYSSTLQNSTEYKGEWLEIDEGYYTAVGTGEDEYGYFDIVANYNICLAGNNDPFVYAEIAFDFGAMIVEGMESQAWEDTGWFFEWYSDPTAPPMLEKSLKEKGITIKKSNTREFNLEGGAKMELTYYLIRRPKKA